MTSNATQVAMIATEMKPIICKLLVRYFKQRKETKTHDLCFEPRLHNSSFPAILIHRL